MRHHPARTYPDFYPLPLRPVTGTPSDAFRGVASTGAGRAGGMEEEVKPTSKQVSYLLTLTKGKYDADAYRYTADAVGKSRMHPDRLTASDFSRAIDKAKTSAEVTP